jgi:hypothetical protein
MNVKIGRANCRKKKWVRSSEPIRIRVRRLFFNKGRRPCGKWQQWWAKFPHSIQWLNHSNQVSKIGACATKDTNFKRRITEILGTPSLTAPLLQCLPYALNAITEFPPLPFPPFHFLLLTTKTTTSTTTSGTRSGLSSTRRSRRSKKSRVSLAQHGR